MHPSKIRGEEHKETISEAEHSDKYLRHENTEQKQYIFKKYIIITITITRQHNTS